MKFYKTMVRGVTCVLAVEGVILDPREFWDREDINVVETNCFVTKAEAAIEIAKSVSITFLSVR